MFIMALWKVAVIFLFVYVCFDGVKSDMVEHVDETNVNERFLKLEREILRLKSVIQYEHNRRLNDKIGMRKTPNIAFRSALGNTISAMKHGSSIVFDIVGLNNGDAYNKHTGKFTAPVNGVYLFSMKIGNPTGNSGTFTLVKASCHTKQFLEYVFAGNTRGWDMGGTTTVTQLVKGESVWVEGEGTANGRYNGPWRFHSTFAGVLLYEV